MHFRRHLRPVPSLGLLLVWGVLGVSAASRQPTALTTAPPPKVGNRQVVAFTEGSRQGVRFDARDGDGVGWWPATTMGNGAIDVDIRGKDVYQQSFVGVAFHGVDDQTFEGVYFRPFNFRAEDPARHAHAVQYVSHPTYTWDKLRSDRPGQFEQPVTPAPDPNAWFHARVVIAGPSVRVFVNDAPVAAFDATGLTTRTTGWVGLWVGNGSGGDFSNLTVTPAR